MVTQACPTVQYTWSALHVKRMALSGFDPYIIRLYSMSGHVFSFEYKTQTAQNEKNNYHDTVNKTVISYSASLLRSVGAI